MLSQHSLDTLSSSLASLRMSLKDQMEAVNVCIHEKMQSPVLLIPEIAGYLITLGGKRLRPLLTLASAELCGYRGNRHISLAACIEFIHTATLLHDDVVDDSGLRRGKKTANTLWDRKACVLVGDFLFSRALELMVEDGSSEVIRILSKASSTIAEGEVLQLSSSHDLRLSKETYLKIIESKTACLFSAAAEIGAVIGNAGSQEKKALGQFGLRLGMAFQLMDDVLDYAADQEKLGKAVGDDFREGKVTLPVILAYQSGQDISFWKETFDKGNQDAGALAHAIHLLKQTGALIKTKHMAQDFVKDALSCLNLFPDSPLKTQLQDLAYFSLHREI